VKEPEQPKPAVTAKSGSVTYRVQIFALCKEKSLIDPEFQDPDDLQMYIENFEPVRIIAMGFPGDPEQLPEDLKLRELQPRKRKQISEFITELGI